RFVAGFVGRSTSLAGTIEAPGRFRSDGGLALACSGGTVGRAALTLRPERIEIGPPTSSGPLSGLDNCLPGTVEFVSYLGALIDIHVRLSPADRLVVQIANREGGFAPDVGQPVHVGWPASAGLVFTE
ncbi:MAG: TOBE domain-containing protein, partial [Hyphomicrobium sp.]|nr:TOBE domain-containing protein [Hyphomicrobium sp.]